MSRMGEVCGFSLFVMLGVALSREGSGPSLSTVHSLLPATAVMEDVFPTKSTPDHILLYLPGSCSKTSRVIRNPQQTGEFRSSWVGVGWENWSTLTRWTDHFLTVSQMHIKKA